MKIMYDKIIGPVPFFVGLADEVTVGLYPIVTLQYSSTTSCQGSYHIRYLCF